jgi:hypothetical protein
MTAAKVDLKRELRELHAPRRTAALVQVPELSFLMVDGHGDPTGVMPLERLWWVPDISMFSIEDKTPWDWTAMIMQPEEVTDAVLADAKQAAVEKGLPALERPNVTFGGGLGPCSRSR